MNLICFQLDQILKYNLKDRNSDPISPDHIITLSAKLESLIYEPLMSQIILWTFVFEFQIFLSL